jgi:hypothetical protein
MMLTARKFVLIFLGLLQFVAPLVHAHSKQALPQFGLHVPHLEIYSLDKFDSPALQASDYLLGAQEVIVSISNGLKPTVSADFHPLSYYFPPTPFVFAICVAATLLNFSPPRRLQAKKFVFSLASPRAPPFFLS